MRKPINIFSLMIVAVAAVAVWTLTQSRAGFEQKVVAASASGINVLDLTMKAKPMPSQNFDAH